MNILVYGGAGFIGQNLVTHLLDSGHNVLVVDSLRFNQPPTWAEQYSLHTLTYPFPDLTFHQCDVRSPGAFDFLHWADVVIPLAALVGAPICEKCPEEAKEVNQDFIEQLVKKMSKSQRISFPMTNSGYGRTDGDSACTEESELSPVSVYGVTKVAAERAVLAHPNSTVFRLATVFGVSPRMRLDLMVNDFASKLAMGGSLSIFEPHFKRNFVGIQDVCRAFIHAIDTGITGCYNLGLPEANLTKLELAHLCCNVLNISREKVTIGNGEDPDKRNYLVSNEKILKTGFQFKHKLEDGIREVANFVLSKSISELRSMRNA